MAYSYRQGAVVTFTRDDGGPGPGSSVEYKSADGWKVEIQDQACVEISQYGVKNGAAPTIVPWHRIWQITTSN
ncbi:hypothetical protein [Umezawaea sp. Da 62-37]|uniref:hypothetical protein n=1 Tax=Umezawaea sp. Da 62-37 TaxID=3075927 RepID=UPI0028F6C60D|nr:hypothetical protein [Umezawaea sp. Da 62-37]WNV85315.1 hypothetical protein RM788_45570 [Umezawaea sp. Da 62-37]